MSNRISIVGTQARDEAMKGIDYLVNGVQSTLGPFGLNILLEKGKTVSNDGYKVSTFLSSSIKNEFQRLAAQTFHEISAKTNDEVGDATTTSEVLGRAILKEAVKLLPNEKSLVSKKTPAQVIKKISEESAEVIEQLKERTIQIDSEEKLIASARVSVEDEKLAELIGKMQWELGPDGIIVAEDTAEPFSSIQKVKGIRIDNGMGAPIMINNQEKQSLEISDCSVIMTNHTIGKEELLKLKEIIFAPLISKGQMKIAIIARAFTADAIKICAEAHQAGLLLYPINAPYTDQTQIMKDMQAVLGGRYIDVEEGSLDDLQLSDVGYATKIEARRFDAIITGQDDEKTQERMAKRVETLKKSLTGEVSDYAKKALEMRISQLSNGFALLKIGSPIEAERRRLKDKADDAVLATRLALKGGTVKGAGLAFKEIAESLPEDYILKQPLNTINDQIMRSAPEGWTVEEWVRDPYLVLESALRNACIGASTMATINMIEAAENPKKCSHGEVENG